MCEKKEEPKYVADVHFNLDGSSYVEKTDLLDSKKFQEDLEKAQGLFEAIRQKESF